MPTCALCRATRSDVVMVDHHACGVWLCEYGCQGDHMAKCPEERAGLVACCKCERRRIESSVGGPAWVDDGDASVMWTLEALEDRGMPVTHTLCPKCYDEELAKIPARAMDDSATVVADRFAYARVRTPADRIIAAGGLQALREWLGEDPVCPIYTSLRQGRQLRFQRSWRSLKRAQLRASLDRFWRPGYCERVPNTEAAV